MRTNGTRYYATHRRSRCDDTLLIPRTIRACLRERAGRLNLDTFPFISRSSRSGLGSYCFQSLRTLMNTQVVACDSPVVSVSRHFTVCEDEEYSIDVSLSRCHILLSAVESRVDCSSFLLRHTVSYWTSNGTCCSTCSMQR